MSHELVGKVVNNYEIRAPIGEGGMGTVYLGQHTFIGRKVAVKVLRRVYSEDPEMVARFMNEARAANAIGHPNIIDIIDVGRLEDGLPYLMMEYLEGETLARRLRRADRLSLLDALAIIKQATAALGAAHAAGIVHRDLKPENIFLSIDGLGQQRVKVLDFGIAKLRDVAGANPVETSGGLLGTPVYMSPEQCRGAGVEVDARADVYAVGTLLYEMLCGQVPFTSQAAGDVLLMQLTATPRPPRSLNPDIPAAIEAVIERALAKSPDDRQPDMESLQRALEEAMIWPPVRTPTPATVVLAVETVAQAAERGEKQADGDGAVLAAVADATDGGGAATASAGAATSAEVPEVIPSWVITPTPASPLRPRSPESAPFAQLLSRPRRSPMVALGTTAAAVALLLFAVGPWSKAASVVTPAIEPPATTVVPATPPAPSAPPSAPPTPPAPTAKAAHTSRPKPRHRRAPRLRAAQAPAPAYMGKW